jgi:uncharacterized protein (DUF362 family)
MPPVTTIPFRSWDKSIPKIMQAAEAAPLFAAASAILIKPNLINDSPHPVTTHPDCCGALVDWIRTVSQAPVTIAEGCGDSVLDTETVFDRLGYRRLAQQKEIALLDLNTAPLREIDNPGSDRFPVVYYPEIAFSHFVVSLPVLKAHSLADITGGMKNMMGFAPPAHYGGGHGSWKKATLHHRLQQAITEWHTVRRPDFTLLDASIGLADFHLGGRRCDPPVNRLLGGTDARAVDRAAAELLGLDWRTIGHLKEGKE